MKNSLIALVVGILFAFGLGLSGMTQPEKVIGFLDVFGNWDPSLMFVMMGAIGVHFVVYKVIQNKKAPLLSVKWHIPNKKEVTSSLLVGSFLFGVGWGLAGYCPGPAVVSTMSLSSGVLIFVMSMLAGMFIFQKTLGKR